MTSHDDHSVKRSKYADIPLPPEPPQPSWAQPRHASEEPQEPLWQPPQDGRAALQDSNAYEGWEAARPVADVPEGREAPAQEVKWPSYYHVPLAQGAGVEGTPDSDAPQNPGQAAPGGQGSPAKPAKGARKTHRGIAMFLGVVFCLVVGAGTVYFIDASANLGRIYQGVSIGSVDVSGMNEIEAEAAITTAYESEFEEAGVDIYADEETLARAKAGEEIQDPETSETISADEAARNRKVWHASAESLGMTIDADYLVEQALAVGRDGGGFPQRVYAQVVGVNIDPAVEFDANAIEELAHSIDRAIGDPHVDFGISIQDGTATVTEGHDGVEVNRTWLSDNLERSLLGDGGAFVAEAEPAAVHIGWEEADAVAQEVNRAISHGAAFSFNGSTWNASAADIGAMVRTDVEQSPDGWKLVPHFDLPTVGQAVFRHLRPFDTEHNIGVQFERDGDAVNVRPNARNVLPDASSAATRLEEATFGSNSEETPVIEVDGWEAPELMSLQEALDAGIIGTICEYTTEYTGGATARNTNIHLAADLLNNSLVAANGGIWSFNEVAGECNADRGFLDASAISGSDEVVEIGGGICQVATTVFNAAFDAGYPIVERRNHSVRIESYPVGRDAAISWPELDLKWCNDTGDDILVQTSWTDTTVTVRLVGVNPCFQVSSHSGDLQGGAPHGTRVEIDPGLPAGESWVRQQGQDGSQITVTRDVMRDTGEILRQDVFVSVYDAMDEIVVASSEPAPEQPAG